MTRIITIGLDCATWDLIKPRDNAQELPNFMRLIEEGTTASLKSTYPPVTPVAWPSLFTEKNPGKHGIFGFTDSDPLSLKIPRVSSNHMKCKPIWDILSGNAKKYFYMFIPIEIDHVQHFFWDDMDRNHPLHNEKTSEKYKDKMIPSTNSNIVKCLIWVTILTLMRSRRILHLIRNANPENAHRYTHLRWAKVFTEQADRLLNEVLECMGLRRGMLTLYEIYLGQGCDPNVERERLMERWVT